VPQFAAPQGLALVLEPRPRAAGAADRVPRGIVPVAADPSLPAD
jgi:hypothetical protein